MWFLGLLSEPLSPEGLVMIDGRIMRRQKSQLSTHHQHCKPRTSRLCIHVYVYVHICICICKQYTYTDFLSTTNTAWDFQILPMQHKNLPQITSCGACDKYQVCHKCKLKYATKTNTKFLSSNNTCRGNPDYTMHDWFKKLVLYCLPGSSQIHVGLFVFMLFF